MHAHQKLYTEMLKVQRPCSDYMREQGPKIKALLKKLRRVSVDTDYVRGLI